MVKRFAQVVSFGLLVVSAALCQDQRYDQRQNQRQPLPDVPSPQPLTQARVVDVFHEQGRSPLMFRGMSDYASFARQREVGSGYEALSHQEKSRTIFDKYLKPSSPKRRSVDSSLNERGVVSRATHAATRILVTRDETGKARLNATYLLRAVTSVAADTASTPYWKRSVGAPFSDFGSTVGSDAGINAWHEVGPGLQHLLENHAPKFVSRIEEHIAHR
jgi:hypothetical protein